jgi:hypothetical protein
MTAEDILVSVYLFIFFPEAPTKNLLFGGNICQYIYISYSIQQNKSKQIIRIESYILYLH